MQWRGMALWAGNALLVVTLLLGAVSVVVLPGPFSRVRDNAQPGWLPVTGLRTLSDGSRGIALLDGRTLRLRDDDGAPLREDPSWWAFPMSAPPRAECGPVQDGRTTVTVWAPVTFLCGNGLATWNPLRKDLDRWGKVAVLRADVVRAPPAD